MRDESGVLGVNAVTLLAAFILVLMVVMGGFTLTSSPSGTDRAPTSASSGPYDVAVNETTLVLEKREGDPAAYDQLAVYVSSETESQQLDLDEAHATGDDGDMLYERGETVRRPLNATVEVPTVTVTLVDAAGSEIRYKTTVNVTTGPVD